MASLTGTLDTINSGKPIAEGQRVAPSFLTGLSDFASTAIPAIGSSLRNIAEDRTDKAMDTAASTMFNAFSQYQADLKNAQTAENQGALPAGSFATRLDAAGRTLMKQFPGQEAELYKYFKDNGWLPMMFKPVEDQLRAEAQDVSLIQGNRKTAIEAYGNAGGLVTAETLDQAYAQGLEILKRDKAAEWARATGAAQAGATGSASPETVVDIKDTATSAMSARGGILMEQMQTILGAASNDAERLRLLPDVLRSARSQLQSQRQAVKDDIIKVGGSADAIKAVNDEFDQYDKMLLSLYNDRISQNSQTMKIIQDGFKLGTWDSAMLFSQLTEAFGSNEDLNLTLNQAFIDSLSPETRTQLTGEITGLVKGMAKPGGITAEAGRDISLMNIVSILKGKTAIDDFTSEDARKKLLKSVVVTTINAASAINTNGYTGGQAEIYLNGARETVVAASKLQPGEPDQTSITNAVRTIASPPIASALRTIARSRPNDPQVFAQIQGARSAAQHLLNVQMNSGPKASENAVYEVRFDKQGRAYNQRIDANFNRAMQQARAAAESDRLQGGAGRLEDYTQDIVKPPKFMTQKVDNINELLGFLVSTTDLDDDMPQGANPVALRMFYGPRSVPLKDAAGKPMISADEQFRQSVEEFKTQEGQPAQPISLPKAPTSFKGAKVSVGDLVSRFRFYGVPDVVAAGIIGNIDAESSFDPRAVNPTSGAKGLIQWLSDDRLKNAKENGFDLDNVEDQIAFIIWELNNSESRAKRELMKAKTPQEAAEIFAEYYVRPEGASNRRPNEIIHIDRRRNTAVAAFGSMQ